SRREVAGGGPTGGPRRPSLTTGRLDDADIQSPSPGPPPPLRSEGTLQPGYDDGACALASEHQGGPSDRARGDRRARAVAHPPAEAGGRATRMFYALYENWA